MLKHTQSHLLGLPDNTRHFLLLCGLTLLSGLLVRQVSLHILLMAIGVFVILPVLPISAFCETNNFVVHTPVVAILAVVTRQRLPLGRHSNGDKLEQVPACSENKNESHFFLDE